MARKQVVQDLIDSTVAENDWAVGWSASVTWEDAPTKGYRIEVKNDKGLSLSAFEAMASELDANGMKRLIAEYVDDPITQSMIDRYAAKKDIGNTDGKTLMPVVVEPIA